jgi:hypothetical protein
MNDHLIADELRSIPSNADFPSRSAALVDVWISDGVGVDAVEPVLRFMEENPSVDFGAPGALVHFLERFYRKGYEERLISSVGRRPTAVTVWMVNRLLNGAKREDERAALLKTLEEVLRNPLADSGALQMANRFLGRRA